MKVRKDIAFNQNGAELVVWLLGSAEYSAARRGLCSRVDRDLYEMYCIRRG